MEALGSEYAETLLLLENWKKKSEADDLFFRGDHTQATIKYADITLEGTNLSKIIEERNMWIGKRDSLMETIEKLTGMNDQAVAENTGHNATISELNELLGNYNSKIDSLQQSLEKLQILHAEQIMALQQQFERDNASTGLTVEENTEQGLFQRLTIQGRDNAMILFFGQVRQGKANGEGTGLWSEGGFYIGEWMENNRHGRGLFLWPEGDKYDGEYRYDLRHGQGSYFWGNGDHYSGNWENNQRHGQGTLYNRNGQVIFSGNWKNDLPG